MKKPASLLAALVICLAFAANALLFASEMGGGTGSGDMAAADYATAGKIKNSTGGTGQDSSAWAGIPKVTGPGTWGKTDFGTAGYFYCDAAGSCAFTTVVNLFNQPSVAATFSTVSISKTVQRLITAPVSVYLKN